jgi:choline dehydrogenase-like flavoprotein
MRPKLAAKADSNFSCELALNHKFWDARYDDDEQWYAKYGSKTASASTIKFLYSRDLSEKNWIEPVPGKRHRVYVQEMLNHPLQTESEKLKNELLEYLGMEDDILYKTPLEYRETSDTPHCGGSLRIGESGSSVVDSSLRFHDYDNLYCCDNSISPHIATANPSLTLAALALRLADDLAQQLEL